MVAPSDPRKLRERKHGLLWFGESPSDRWNITDPESEELSAAVFRLRSGFFLYGGNDPRTSEEKQRDSDMLRLIRAVEDYHYLTTYALGIEHIIKKLRVIWRAVREAPEKTLGVGQPVCISCLVDIPGIDPRVCAACASKGIR